MFNPRSIVGRIAGHSNTNSYTAALASLKEILYGHSDPFRFETVDGADNALGVIPLLHEQQLITVLDAALVSWPKGKNRPSTRQVVPPTGTQLLDGTFWGMLFGLIFFVPVLDTGRREEMDRLTCALSNVGIDEVSSARCEANLPKAHRRYSYFHGML